MADAKLNILVAVKDSASNALARLSNELGDLGGNVAFAASEANGLVSALAAVGAGAAIGSAVNAFAEGEAQMANFEAVMSSLSPKLQVFRDEILRLAEDAMMKYGFSNEVAAISLARLLKITGNMPDAVKAFNAAMGLAKLQNIDLSGAVDQVAKVLLGKGVRGLEEYGIKLSETNKPMQNLQNITSVTTPVLQKFTETTQKSKDVISELGGEVQKSFGGVFSDAVKRAENAIVNFVNQQGGMTALLERSQPVLLLFAGLLSGVVVTGFVFATAAAIALVVALSPISLTIGGIILLFSTFAAIWLLKWPEIKAGAKLALDGIVAAFKYTQEAVAEYFWKPIFENVDKAITKLTQLWDWLTKIASKIGSGVSGAASGVFNSIKSGLGINDGVVQNGRIITTHPDDFIIATKNPSSLGGGGGIVINLQGDFYTDTETAERFGNQLARVIKNQLNLGGIRA